jgi:ATP synthase F1 delta subunit
MSLAYTYAKAFYESAQEVQLAGDTLATIELQMKCFTEFLETSKAARDLFCGPVATLKEKVELVEEVSKGMGMHPLFKQFLILLIRKRRLQILKEIHEALSSVRVTQEGGVEGYLVCAETIADADTGALSKAFSQKLGKKVAFRVSYDPSLLAGMKVTVNGVTYDGSLRSQISKLRDQFIASTPGLQG